MVKIGENERKDDAETCKEAIQMICFYKHKAQQALSQGSISE